MNDAIQPGELAFFSVLAASPSFGAAARELGVTTAAVSKRLALIEGRLGVSLVNRTTRRMSLTPEGAICLEHARRMLAEIEELGQRLRRSKGAPSGLLRVHATPGFGRRHVAPAVSEFVRRYPQAEVRLMLAADPPPLDDDAFDVSIRFGAPPEARVVARLIARNRRVLVAAPAYLAQHGTPQAAADLARHDCIVIRQGDDAHGQWRLIARSGAARGAPGALRVRGSLSSNDGEVALAWALEGRGILLRSEWDVAPHLARGALVRVLPEHHTPEADIYAVYAPRHRRSPRVRAFIELLVSVYRSAAGDGR